MSIFSNINCLFKSIIKQKCSLCHQSSKDIVCDYCFTNLTDNLNLTKQNIELGDNYDCYHLTSYTPEIRFLLQRFKFSKDLLAATVFERLIKQWWLKFAKEKLSDVDAVAIVPIHRLRYLYRGFNQAEVLAQGFAEMIEINTTFEYYKRSKYTKSQSKSSKAQRAEQISGVFELLKPIKSKHLIVFDDVLTTGSTLKEFIETIKVCSEIEKISVVTLVRAG